MVKTCWKLTENLLETYWRLASENTEDSPRRPPSNRRIFPRCDPVQTVCRETSPSTEANNPDFKTFDIYKTGTTSKNAYSTPVNPVTTEQA